MAEEFCRDENATRQHMLAASLFLSRATLVQSWSALILATFIVTMCKYCDHMEDALRPRGECNWNCENEPANGTTSVSTCCHARAATSVVIETSDNEPRHRATFDH
mmetsp:Transcript_53123/g.119217  ORF Transcript_53123/g.119217 Transcript_53123/m.119217 type:complete len:106 (-) Transcript_53123:396-713(-)